MTNKSFKNELIHFSPPLGITISVTTEHLLLGEKRCLDSCPIALALLGHGFTHVKVNGDTISFYDRLSSPVYLETPLVVKTFISHFDDGLDLLPFDFVL